MCEHRACARVRVTRRQEFPRGSIVIAGALSRLKTSLQEQREGAPSAIIPLSSLRRSVLHTLASLSLCPVYRCFSLFVPPPPPPRSLETLLHHVPPAPFSTLPPQGGASLLLRLSIGEFDFSASGVRDTSMPEEDVLVGICFISKPSTLSFVPDTSANASANFAKRTRAPITRRVSSS